jgi:protein-S-isoprenylcysteine O-methyltransferase Ste14
MGRVAVADPADERAEAIKRINARRDFTKHVVVYAVVNAALILIWLVTSTGYFWPGWVLGGWGIGLALHAWDTYGRRPISEDDIQREIQRSQRSGGAEP